jgi:hypothetical protein
MQEFRAVIVTDDVVVRRANGERCTLSSLTGNRAVVVLGATMDELGDVLELPTLGSNGSTPVLGIQRLEPVEPSPAAEIVFDDAHAAVVLLESPAMPAAWIVHGVTPLGPPVTGSAEIRHLVRHLTQQHRSRVSGALGLGDLVG